MLPFLSTDPGRLDRRISLRYPEETRDAAGGVATVWSQGATVWAEWTPASGREIQQAGQKIAVAAGLFRIRWRSALRANWRVVFDGQVFELIAPPVEVGRRLYLDLPVRSLPITALPITDEDGAAITDEDGVAVTG